MQGKRYRRTLVRIDDEEQRLALGAVMTAKYGDGPAGGDLGRVWFFRLDPRR